MRQFLFISFLGTANYSGGKQCSQRNLQSLKALLGNDNVVQYIVQPYLEQQKLITMIERVKDIFCGYMGGLSARKSKQILSIIEKKSITDIFLDSSLFGILAKKIKKKFKHVRIYTFFHNVEYDFFVGNFKSEKDFFHLYWIPLAFLNEKNACKYSDRIISLNSRDACGLIKYYKHCPDSCIPITLNDIYHPNEEMLTAAYSFEKPCALFVGSNFYGNTIGLKWFCREVLPMVNIELIIVGSGMNKLTGSLGNESKIRIYSDVPDLTPYYEMADFVVLPILSGAGMKVKTAESLMYGKYIVGTAEAMTGYEVSSDVATICNSKEEFIECINGLKLNKKFNKPSRLLFERKYSFDSSYALFAQLLSDEF